MSSHLPSILVRHARSGAATAADLEALKLDWWRREAGVCVRLDEIGDDWLRQALANFARKRWGSRVAR